jgi:hypothetical protein
MVSIDKKDCIKYGGVVMKERTSSAGIMYFYLRGTLDENNQVCIYVQDTYKYLPDKYYERVCKDFSKKESDKNVVYMFGVIGTCSKVYINYN